MLLTEPKKAQLVKPNLKVTKVHRFPELSESKRHIFTITLSSESIAPFVLLDFKVGSGLKGQFVENGFFIFDGQKTIKFVTDMKISEEEIRDNLVIKTVTDVV